MQETIVLYPALGMGHVICTVELGKLIFNHYKNQFSITILLITSEVLHDPSIDLYVENISKSYPFITFRRFPYLPVDKTPTRSKAAIAFECIRNNTPNALHSLKEISAVSKVKAFVIDLFCGPALSVARELNIPTYFFFTSGAACLSSFLYLPTIHEQHHESFKDLFGVILDFPGIPPLKAIHLPEPILDRKDPAYNDFIYFCTQLPKADGIMVNSFDSLEPKALEVLSNNLCVPNGKTPPIYCIGPLIAGQTGAQHHCLSWLDKQPSKSVVFLCFGSRGTFTREQLKEIADGLERTGERFLWVVKNVPLHAKIKQTDHTTDFELDSILPEGFVERVKDRALVVKAWAPQVAVLNHDAVAAFVTHCGWNSTLEAVVAGVPMVAWPLHAEQHINRNLLVEEMKLAVGVEQRDEDGYVNAAEVERRVKEMMGSDRGRELRQRSLTMREKASQALGESGSSIKALDKLIQRLKHG
ncbi:hypothetical protein K2173_007131 [Erythroxylum novogranatense]|uniref:Glycosyltransferase n=1 Tax=Erythroxylum novogranatense TaxID=1862640 RepID=A0AAV8SZG0_9ROSI|nr:hypothetical protein K2173_007131 [Erythroxylum novogranatense]